MLYWLLGLRSPGTIDNHKGWNNIGGDVECYRRQFERSSKFARWGGCGSQSWWWGRYRAWLAERRWWTWLGYGHNLQNGTALDGALSAEADEVWWTDTNRMGGRSLLFPWERYRLWDDWTEGSGSSEDPNRCNSSHTITDNIWRAYAGFWYRPRTIPNATSDVLTGN